MSAQAAATVVLSLVDKITGPIKRISARLSASLSAIGKRIGFDRITRSIGKVGLAFKGLGAGILKTTGRLSAMLALAGLGSGGALGVMLGLSKATADLGKEIDKLSKTAGMTPIAFQKWAFAGKTVGVESEKMSDILKDVNDKIGDYFNTGGGPMKDFFEQMPKRVGKSAKALEKSFKGLSSADALQLYVSTLEKANVSQAEMTFYMEAIASDATWLVPLLRDGGKEMRRLGDEAGRAGGILGESAIKLSKDFSENIAKVMSRFQGLRNFIGIQLMPIFNDLAKSFTKWYDANAKLIRLKITEWARTLRQVFRDLLNPASDLRKKIDEFAQGFSNAYQKIKPFVDFLGGPLNAALALIGVWVLAPAITAVALLALAFGGLGAAVARVSFAAILLAFKGLGKVFGTAADDAGKAGAAAGKSYGRSFGLNMKSALRVGFLGLGAWAAAQIISDMPSTPEEWAQRQKDNVKADADRNKWLMDNGGNAINKYLGFEFMREKDGFENSPAKKIMDAIGGLFGGGGDNRAAPGVDSALRIADATRARQAGFGRTTENLPGKTADDIVTNQPIIMSNDAAPAPVVNETKTINAPQTVNLTIHTQAMTPGELSAAVTGVMRRANDEHAAGVAASLSD